MHELEIYTLLEKLKNPSEEVREQATRKIWSRWFRQKGIVGLEILQRAQTMLQTGEIESAEKLLAKAIADFPDFAEAWNTRAILYYLQGDYRKSIADCQRVIQLNPVHFGALHGLGLCYAQLGEYRRAIAAFQRALEIQPYAIENQRLILECTEKLN